MHKLRTRMRVFLAIVAGIFGASELQARSHFLRDFNFTKLERRDNSVLIKTNGLAQLELRVMSDDLIRVRLNVDGNMQKKPSLSVLSEDWPNLEIQVLDEADQVRMITSMLELRVQKFPLQLNFYTADGKKWITGEKNSGGLGWRDEDGQVSLHQELGSSEHIYGLGEDNDAFLGHLDRRGFRRDMWTNQEIRKGHVTADIPINFFMSTGNAGGAYGMFFDNTYRSSYDMGASARDTWVWQAEGGEALFYLFFGPEFSKILNRFTELTGRPSMPPLWSLGFIQSKCCYWDWNEIDSVTQTMTEKKIPFDVMVIDYNWSKVPMDFQWADRWGTEVTSKLQDYGEQGVRFLLSTAGPMVRKDASNYQDGLKQGVFANDGHGNTVSCGHYGGDLLDFTSPKIKDWLWPQVKPLYEQGIDGWWLDLTEPEGEPVQTVYHDGPRAGIHNPFAMLNSKTYYEMQTEAHPEDRVFILNRTGFAGIQRYGTAIWTGDTWSDYATYMAHVPEALNTTMSGIPYWTNDSGGFLQGLYKDNLEDHGRLYERWLEFSVFSPITRVHHVGPSAPYMFGEKVEATARKYISQRYRLLPYIYSHSWEAFLNGTPLMRPLIYDFQNDPAVTDLKDEYLFGKNMLVAPVMTEKTEQRLVYFPKGRWIDQDYAHVFEGNQTYCVAAPRDRIPVFIRSGAIIPKAPLMQHTGEKPWDPLTLEFYPDGESHFKLYQDDGISTNFHTNQAYTETMLASYEDSSQSVYLRISEGNKLFVPKYYQALVHLKSRPLSVSLDGQIIPQIVWPEADTSAGATWSWDEHSAILAFAWPNNESLVHEAKIQLDGQVLSPPRSTLSLSDCPDVALPSEHNEGAGQQIANFFPPPSLPGQVQAENYDKGGEGIAWHDSTAGNQGGEYRSDDVDLLAATDIGGGYAISDISDGEWYEYTLVASKAGFYELNLRVAAQEAGGQLHIERDGQNLSGSIAVPSTGGGQIWTDIIAPLVYLKQGEQILRLAIDRGGFQINHFRFSPASHPSGPAALCGNFSGGYGEAFTCFDKFSCKKINEDWQHNQLPDSWCLLHEF